MRRLALLAVWGFGPGFLQADVNGGVDDAGFGDVRTREEDELRLVINPVGLDLRRVSHSVDPIHRTAKQIKIFLRGILECSGTTLREAQSSFGETDSWRAWEAIA